MEAKPLQAIRGAPTLDELARLSRLLHGEELEWLLCQMDRSQCSFGGNAASGAPYAGEAGTWTGGILVWLDRGLVLSNHHLATPAK